jgi:glyoxylase-like metal-dependent hydrolase (beta-lactamase superfamily II)
MNWSMFVGEIRIDPVVDGSGWVGVEHLLRAARSAVADPTESLLPFVDDHGRIELTMGGFLVRTGDRVILVDAGMGPYRNGPLGGGAMLDSLTNLGISPTDITDVLLTHLHFDHIGWCSQNDAAVFSNAIYRCHAADWNHFVTGPGTESGTLPSLLPAESQFSTFDTDVTIAPGVTVRHAPGHTPGSTIVVLSSGTDRAMLIGDVAHCPAELTNDEWEMTFDVDPLQATATRAAVARELEGSGAFVAAAHFPALEFGRLMRGEGRRNWTIEKP